MIIRRITLIFIIWICLSFSLATVSTAATMPGLAGEVTIYYFYINVCVSCFEAERMLDQIESECSIELQKEGKRLILEKYNIIEGKNLELLNRFFDLYRVPKPERSYPIVFVGNKWIYGSDAITGLLKMEILKKDIGKTLSPEETIVPDFVGTTPVSDIAGLKAVRVFLTGFVNGLSPCSLSILLLFLSLLAIGRQRILKTGLAFCAGKFISYMLLGTVLYSLLSKINIWWFYPFIKIFALAMIGILVCLNLSDFISARKERYDRIKLQLPLSLRRFNSTLAKKVAGTKGDMLLIFSGLILGIVTSAGEFLCTGQIYLATIIYGIKDIGSRSGYKVFYYFVLYNIAFVLPMLILTLAVYKGRVVYELTEAVRKYMPVIKIANAIILLLLGVCLLFWF